VTTGAGAADVGSCSVIATGGGHSTASPTVGAGNPHGLDGGDDLVSAVSLASMISTSPVSRSHDRWCRAHRCRARRRVVGSSAIACSDDPTEVAEFLMLLDLGRACRTPHGRDCTGSECVGPIDPTSPRTSIACAVGGRAAAIGDTYTVTGRFAPSPTGDLHLGNLRTAALAWLSARSRGERFLVRMEDLDRQQASRQIEQAQLHDLRSIGLDWDGEVVRQSERFDRYEAAISELASRSGVRVLLQPSSDPRRDRGVVARAARSAGFVSGHLP
jgi:hypothetical protein